ncbi:hypothetical protein PPS11_16106 [Pseudomonas putida S11]|nr:hypothetical protein PPS11_16106 [Pseudomonas putida S11]
MGIDENITTASFKALFERAEPLAEPAGSQGGLSRTAMNEKARIV